MFSPPPFNETLKLEDVVLEQLDLFLKLEKPFG